MKKKAEITVVSEDSTTTTGTGTNSTQTTMQILGFSDTQIDPGVFDPNAKETLIKVSLAEMGNRERQARNKQTKVKYGHFGPDSSQAAIQENLDNSEKAPQLNLGNVLGLSSMPKPSPK